MSVPNEIIAAVNSLLAPYGESYTPRSESAPASGYKSAKDAAAYLGVSKSSLYKAVRQGRIHPIKLNKAAKNGKAVFAVSDLEAYISASR